MILFILLTQKVKQNKFLNFSDPIWIKQWREMEEEEEEGGKGKEEEGLVGTVLVLAAYESHRTPCQNANTKYKTKTHFRNNFCLNTFLFGLRNHF